MKFKTALQLLLLLTLQGVLMQNLECSIGVDTDVQGAIQRDPAAGQGVFYLDRENTAGCSGQVERIKYCYHSQLGVSTNTTEAQFSIYRRRGFIYNRVSDVFRIRNRLPFETSNELQCEYLELEMAVQVEEGDAFGICLPNSGGNEVLSILSESSGGTLNTLPCDVVPQDNFFRFALSESSDVRLHLYAITNTTQVIVTSGPEFSTTDPTQVSSRPELSTTDAGDTTDPTQVSSSRPEFRTTVSGAASTENSPNDSGSGVTVGITLAVLLLVLGAGVVVLVIVLVIRKRKKSYYSKATSNLARNHFTINSTTEIAAYNSVGEEAHYETVNVQEGEGQWDQVTAMDAVYENPLYFPESAETRQSVHSGKDEEGYYAPNSVTYSQLDSKDKDLNPYQTPAGEENELYAQLRRYDIKKISRNELEAQQHQVLGSGQFGTVKKGIWNSNGVRVEVALKMLKEDSETDTDKIKLLQEAVIMAQFQHANVLYLHGVARQGEAIIIVTELAHKGDLREYLLSIKSDPITSDIAPLLLSFSRDISQGMQYLSSKGFIHRDLAARNILVTNSNTCKVADFGMSRDLFDGTYYVSSGGKVPLKWTAPESLHYSKFSTASDVWSFGCVLYEIWSLGTKPFYRMKNEDVIGFIDAGKRLSPPPGCPRVIYEVMIACWHPEASSRPSFHDLILALHGNDKVVLEVPLEDEHAHPDAARLGASVQAGAAMYHDLCMLYSHYSPTADRKGFMEYECV